MKSSDKPQIKFLITGGHLTPALAVIEELKKLGYKNFFWFGRKKTMRGDKEFSAEYQVVSRDLNIPFIDAVTGKVVRFADVGTFIDFLINVIKIPLGFIHSAFTICKYRPQVIISFGGYVALPMVTMSKFFRIPSVTHEQTVVTGLANKIISRFANKILISWKDSEKFFDKSKTVFVGNPVRKEVLEVTTNNFQLNKNLKTIYITGGNQGSHIMNNAIEPIIKKLLKKYNVIHQTGVTSITGDFEKFDKLEKALLGKTKGIYFVRGTIYGPEIGEVFSKADLLISRSGANIITDILAISKPAILIPIPWSINNEQFRNAKMLEKVGIGKIIEQKDLDSEILLESIEQGFENIKKGKDFNGKSLTKAQIAGKALIRFDAAERIVREVFKLI